MTRIITLLDPWQHPPDEWAIEAIHQCDARLDLPRSPSPSDRHEACRDAEVVLVGGSPLSAALIEDLERCRAVVRIGTGYDNVDVEAASARGIAVCNVPEFCTDEVADHAFALLLACARQLPRGDALLRAGKWDQFHLMPAHSLRGRVLGLAGYGKIARAVAHRARAFGLDVCFYDPAVGERDSDEARGCESLKKLFRDSDIVSLHLPLTEETRGLIGLPLFRLMKPSALLINCARGEIIVEDELVAALQQGLIAGAGLDVFAPEPPRADNPLVHLPNVVLSPHCAAHTVEALQRLRRQAYEEACRALRGESLRSCVNEAQLKGRGQEAVVA